jgi:hypothetical protein
VKLSIATKDLQAAAARVYSKRMPARTQLRLEAILPDTLMIDAGQEPVEVTATIIADGCVCMQAKLFSKILESYQGTPAVELEAFSDSLRINSFRAPILAWNPPTGRARRKGANTGLNLTCVVGRDEFIGHLRSVLILAHTDAARLEFSPGKLEIVSNDARTSINIGCEFRAKILLSRPQISSLCRRNLPPQKSLRMSIYTGSSTLGMEHWEGRVKILEAAEDKAVPIGVEPSLSPTNPQKVGDSVNNHLETASPAHDQDQPGLDLPFINLDGIDFVIQTFTDAALFLIERFNPPPLQLAKLALALDDLKNLRVRAPLRISQFGIRRKYDRSSDYNRLTLQMLMFEVSSERLDICYIEAQPGDSMSQSYTLWPEEIFQDTLDIFDVLRDLESLSGGSAELITRTVGAVDFNDSSEM